MLSIFILKTYVGCFMASRISIKVEEEVRVLAEHCWELGSKQKHVQKSRKLPDLFKYVHLRKMLSLLFPTMALPHLFLFSSQERQLKAQDLYVSPEVLRSLLYWPNAHYIIHSHTQEELKAISLRLASFFYCNIQPQETGANIVYF